MDLHQKVTVLLSLQGVSTSYVFLRENKVASRLFMESPQTICFSFLGRQEGRMRAPENLAGHAESHTGRVGAILAVWECPALGCRSWGPCGLPLLFL